MLCFHRNREGGRGGAVFGEIFPGSMGSYSCGFRALLFTILIVRFLLVIIGKLNAVGRTRPRCEMGADGL
jgi:hypothetical protein